MRVTTEGWEESGTNGLIEEKYREIMPFSYKMNHGSLERWLSPRLGQEISSMSLRGLQALEIKKVFKNQ